MIPGIVSEELSVPAHIDKPTYYYAFEEPSDTFTNPELVGINSIAIMRDTCRLAATILDKCQDVLKVCQYLIFLNSDSLM